MWQIVQAPNMAIRRAPALPRLLKPSRPPGADCLVRQTQGRPHGMAMGGPLRAPAFVRRDFEVLPAHRRPRGAWSAFKHPSQLLPP